MRCTNGGELFEIVDNVDTEEYHEATVPVACELIPGDLYQTKQKPDCVHGSHGADLSGTPMQYWGCYGYRTKQIERKN